MKKLIAILLLSYCSGSACRGEAPQSQREDLGLLAKTCKPGLNALPNSSFSISCFCEGALGNYAAIVLTEKWSASSGSGWTVGDRYWYEATWGDDFTSYYYDEFSKSLYITTQGYYGTAGLYRLDLEKRNASKIIVDGELKSNLEGGYLIVNVDGAYMEVTYEGPHQEISRKIKMNPN